MTMVAPTTLMDPFSASSKDWQHPTFSLEDRIAKKEQYASPDPAAAPLTPPDEERGRKIRSSSSNQSIVSFAQQTHACPRAVPAVTRTASFATYLDEVRLVGQEDERSFETYKRDVGRGKWKDAVDKAYNDVNGSIDLCGQDLVEIPSRIDDLSKLVKIAPPDLSTSSSSNLFRAPRSGFSRDTQSGPLPFSTTPPLRPRTFLRTQSVATFPSSSPASTPTSGACIPIDLFLSSNQITTPSISPKLFALPNLRVLSLRDNKLDSLPPGVGRLAGLETLNIGSNQIKYLPAEILQCEKLAQVFLHPNPFLSPPPPITNATRQLGPLTTNFALPSLLEISHRVLLDSPILPSPYFLPPHLSIPYSPSFDPLSNICPSPTHAQEGGNRFVEHAAERIEWVKESELLGPGRGKVEGGRVIPVRWRGCSTGCLDFLDE